MQENSLLHPVNEMGSIPDQPPEHGNQLGIFRGKGEEHSAGEQGIYHPHMAEIMKAYRRNPKGISSQRRKAEYSDRFTFWGGGFIFNTIHNVVANVPPENLIAMYETVLGEKIR